MLSLFSINMGDADVSVMVVTDMMKAVMTWLDGMDLNACEESKILGIKTLIFFFFYGS